MSEPMIRLESLSRVYPVGDTEVRALDQVDLSIEAGEYISLMGPSGSGKSPCSTSSACSTVPPKVSTGWKAATPRGWMRWNARA